MGHVLTGIFLDFFYGVGGFGAYRFRRLFEKAISALFASDTAMLLLLGMLMVGPMVESNTGEWLLVKLLNSKFCYKKPWNFTILMIFGLGILSYVVRPIIIALFMLALFKDLFDKAGYEKGDKYPTMLIMGLFIAMLLMTAIFPCSMAGGYMVQRPLPKVQAVL